MWAYLWCKWIGHPTEKGAAMTWWETLGVSTLGGFISLSLKWLFDLGRHKLSIRGQKDIFVHKTQFEKEFNAYAEIWTNIPDLKNYIMTYDDICSEKLIERREKDLPELFEKTTKMISENEPFLHPDVFEACVQFISQIRVVEKLNRKLINFEKAADERARENAGSITGDDSEKWEVLIKQWYNSLEEINKQQENIKESIRKRIWNRK